CEPQPADGGEGEYEEPRPRPPADHRRREGPHGAVGDRERGLQAAEAEPSRDGDREDAEPRPLPHDRPRLARGRRDCTRIRQAVTVPASSKSGPATISPSGATITVPPRVKTSGPSLGTTDKSFGKSLRRVNPQTETTQAPDSHAIVRAAAVQTSRSSNRRRE